MSTSKSTPNRANEQAPLSAPLPARPTLTLKQKQAINFILWLFRDYNGDFSEMNGTVNGPDGWFKEFVKSERWIGMSNECKDEAFKHYENLKYLLTSFEEQGDILFPDGGKSEEIAIPEN